MPAFAHDEFIARRNLRTRIIEALRRRGEGRENIEFGDRRGGLADPTRLFGDTIADLLKEILLDFENLFLGGQYPFFVFLELRCNEAFRSNKRLLPIVVTWHK